MTLSSKKRLRQSTNDTTKSHDVDDNNTFRISDKSNMLCKWKEDDKNKHIIQLSHDTCEAISLKNLKLTLP